MDIKKIEEGKKFFKRTKLLIILDEFERMDGDVAEVIYGEKEYANAASAYGALKEAIKRFGKGSTINVRTLDGKVYLIKETGAKVAL